MRTIQPALTVHNSPPLWGAARAAQPGPPTPGRSRPDLSATVGRSVRNWTGDCSAFASTGPGADGRLTARSCRRLSVRLRRLSHRNRTVAKPPNPAVCHHARNRPLRRNGASHLNDRDGREADAARSSQRNHRPVQSKAPVFLHPSRATIQSAPAGFQFYHEPVLAMLVQGSAGGSAAPACSSSMEMPSGVRMKAMRPSRGGRLIVTPWAMKALQVS